MRSAAVTILAMLFLQTDTCKKRWGNIRDQYKKHLNKRKSKSGQGATITKKYKYEENLNFLLPHVEDRCTITNIESESEKIQEETEAMQSQQAFAPHEPEMFNTDKQQQEPRVNFQPNMTPSTDYMPTSQSTAQLSRSQKRKRRLIPQPEPSASNTLMEYIIKNNEEAKQDIHPIDAFFTGLAATVKKFSPYHQHVAKGKIFAVVQELEWEQLSPAPSSYTSPMSETSSSTVYTVPPTQTPPICIPPEQSRAELTNAEATLAEPQPLEPTPSTSTNILGNNMSAYFSHFK